MSRGRPAPMPSLKPSDNRSDDPLNHLPEKIDSGVEVEAVKAAVGRADIRKVLVNHAAERILDGLKLDCVLPRVFLDGRGLSDATVVDAWSVIGVSRAM